MIAIVDYGMGNLRSAQKGFEKAGHEAVVTDDPERIETADAVVLPGVGAFKDCYDGLGERGLIDVVKRAATSGRPFLGICVGMQLLFEYSEEGAGSVGLGILPGRIVRFPEAAKTGLKVPHMGWNQLLRTATDCPLLPGKAPLPYVYFVHSYYADTTAPEIVAATCDYGVRFPAMVCRDTVFATQFHPEKSQAGGIEMLRRFGQFVATGIA